MDILLYFFYDYAIITYHLGDINENRIEYNQHY